MSAALAALSFLRRVPWQAWALLALLAGLGWFSHSRYQAGYAAAQAKCEADAAAALAEAVESAAQDAETARQIGIDTGREAARLQADIAASTATSVERIRYVTRTIEVPAGCPASLPDGVRVELQAAADRARAAAR